MATQDPKNPKNRKTGKRLDALSGRFAVTEELEAWAAEQKARRARRDGSKFETTERSTGSMVLVVPSREVETLRPVELRPEDYELEPTGLRMGAGMHQLIFPFKTLVSVEATDPYPTFEIEWRHMGGKTRRRFLARFRSDEEAWVASVEKIFAHLDERFPHVVHRGWLDAQNTEWEPAAGFPDERTLADEKRGGYRLSARDEPAEEVVAERASPEPLEAMMDWLSSGPDSPWREHPNEVKVTVSHVYVRRRDDAVYRLPLSALRGGRKNSTGDIVYVFGRRTRLLLPHRDGCPVVTALNALL
ncbi:MAG: hypothetical protein DRJ42_10785 [Deltaproteobacteria bacterium]|nr:MAG: hypothetical protein DRJ42_10785 [Deltaproteobacteria bacterium]